MRAAIFECSAAAWRPSRRRARPTGDMPPSSGSMGNIRYQANVAFGAIANNQDRAHDADPRPIIICGSLGRHLEIGNSSSGAPSDSRRAHHIRRSPASSTTPVPPRCTPASTLGAEAAPTRTGPDSRRQRRRQTRGRSREQGVTPRPRPSAGAAPCGTDMHTLGDWAAPWFDQPHASRFEQMWAGSGRASRLEKVIWGGGATPRPDQPLVARTRPEIAWCMYAGAHGARPKPGGFKHGLQFGHFGVVSARSRYGPATLVRPHLVLVSVDRMWVGSDQAWARYRAISANLPPPPGAS